MSRSTPRKHQNRGHQSHPSLSHPSSQPHYGHVQNHSHTRNRSQQLQSEAQQQQFLATSDYESDTAHYMASHPQKSPASLAVRTNTELNMSVLKRYLPSITSILSIAANAVIYTFQPPAEWKTSSLQGTMFVCTHAVQEQDGNVSENVCLFVLNRKGPQNYILDLKKVDHFEYFEADKLMVFKFEDSFSPREVPLENEEIATPHVVGMWAYAEDEEDRKSTIALIYEMWSKMREAQKERAAAGHSAEPVAVEANPSAQGRQISVGDLFKSQNGTNTAGF
ncbi:hypothetical protein F5Y15DRAFT_73488 [Xylariaceae sp. FL0016]|nr:hypothetical protein F5Y15DRAFT_73488 [Xylariaceae sp. FL0016]